MKLKTKLTPLDQPLQEPLDVNGNLFPCPFCGGNNTQIRRNFFWTGLSNQTISVEVVHWCERKPGQLDSVVRMKGKTEEAAIEAWNRRQKEWTT